MVQVSFQGTGPSLCLWLRQPNADPFYVVKQKDSQVMGKTVKMHGEFGGRHATDRGIALCLQMHFADSIAASQTLEPQ